MKLLFFILVMCSISFSQPTIEFDNNGWNSNQKIGNTFEADGFTFGSNKSFYTNYGRGFDIYSISIYFVWEDNDSLDLVMSTEENGTIKLMNISAYQVSEVTDYVLTIQGFNDDTLKYTKSFTDLNSWQILDLNYDEINKIEVSLSATRPYSLIDFNFDSFTFLYGKRYPKAKL